MKTYNVTKRLSKQAKQSLQSIIDTHDKYKNSYMWSSGGNATDRRYRESRFEQNNSPVEFITSKGKIVVNFDYRESCKNIYYKLYVRLYDSVGHELHKTIREIKQMLKGTCK